MSAEPSRSRFYPVAGLVWFLIALVVGASGVLLRMPPRAPQVILLGLTTALVIAGVLVPSFRAWLAAVDLRSVIAIHLTRFIGIYFLMLFARGLLPYDFAVVGGWGDIAVAVTAVLWLVFSGDPARHRRLLALWNVGGLLDIVFVVVTAARMALADPASMGPLRVLPLSLLPTIVVPLIIASHVLIFWRLFRAAGREV